MSQIFLVLDNLRSVHNVGALFRTADAVGVSKIYCVGTTPTPLDRFLRERKDFIKAALGAEKSVPWEVLEIKPLLDRLKKEGVQIVVLEQAEQSLDYKTVTPHFPCALVIGSETEGVSKELLDASDLCIEIPMRGKKESLNASVAGGIALYRLFDR